MGLFAATMHTSGTMFDSGPWLIFMLSMIAFSIVMWGVAIWVIVDVVRRPEQDFVALGFPKAIIVIIALLAGFIGVILYLAMWRPKLNEIRRARESGAPMPSTVGFGSLVGSTAAPVALPPPGWFQMPGDPIGVQRWWDGARWTQHTHGTAMPPPNVEA